MRISSFLLASIALGLLGCATYSEDLNRGQRMYEENKYENALAIWRVLEPDTDSLSLNDQARYAYLRGMTDFRLGYRADSRHWLALAKATEQEHAGGLSIEWKDRLEQSLADLNQDVYGGAERFDKSNSTAVEHTKDAPSDSTPPSDTPVNSNRGCRSNAECPSGMICDGKTCTPL
ncbi:MAG TPA: hypothetical protein VHV51_10795 [Polyangiaceae bacterium]|jgi:hypothetical protein|nr:hypothetical protein [Polyangiaceae bacterium]